MKNPLNSAQLRPGPLMLLLGISLVLVIVAAASNGAVSIAWHQLPQLLFAPSRDSDALTQRILIDIRIPRVLFSSLNGAALAVAGVAMQALFRNPLAEPALIGISSGAALGAVSAIVLANGGFLMISSAAFAGSLIATLLAYAMGRRFPGMAGLLLAGIAINTVAGSAIGLFTYMADDTQLRDLTFWTMGSLAGGNWQTLALLSPVVIVLMAYLCLQWRAMNALLLGEREAAHLGFQLAAVRGKLIVATALMTGPLVAVTGGIGFIGLVVPHLVRLLIGAHHRYLLPISILAGAVLLTLADWLARILISPAELPIGLVTSLVGGPFFFWLLCRTRSLNP